MEIERNGVITTPKERVSMELLFAITLFLPMFFSNLTEILVALGLPSLMLFGHILLYVLYAILFFYSLLRRPDVTVGIFILASVAILMSCLTNADVARYIFNFGDGGIATFQQSNIMLFLSRCVLSIIVFSAQLDIHNLTDYLKKYSFYLVLLYVVMNMVNFTVYGQSTSYMNNAYMALVPTSLLYVDSMEKKKTVRLLFAVFASLLVVVSGSRGAAICMIGVIGLYHILSGKMTVKKFAVVLVVVSASIVLILNLESILMALSGLFAKMGISTRLIDLVNGKENGIYQLSGRDDIYLGAVSEFGIFGSGLFYDRLLRSGGYVHNFIIEVILNYGYFIGIAILLFLLVKILRSVSILRRDPRLDVWAAIIIVIMCIKYMVSDSYLISQDFWLLMGIIFSVDSKRYKKTKDPL